jgi:predicted dehydrogenase
LGALEAIVGPYVDIDARNSILLEKVRRQGSTEFIKRTCADHMIILGKHPGGCVSSLEVVGGVPSLPFLLELVGDQGSLKLTGGHAGGCQVGNLKLETSFRCEPPCEPVVPELGKSPAANLAEAYTRFAADIRSGTRTVPDFEVAVRLTKLLDKIDTASQTGVRQTLEG